MVSLALGMMAVAGFLTVYITFLMHSESAATWWNADNDASMAVERMVRGFGDTPGLREYSRGSIDTSYSADEWSIEDGNSGYGYTFSSDDQTISDLDGNIIIENVAESELSYSNDCINLSVAIVSTKGEISSTQEYHTTVQPRNE